MAFYLEYEGYNKKVIHDALMRLCDKIPESPEEFVKIICFTAYMGTKHNSEESRTRASQVAAEIGSWHMENTIDELHKTISKTFAGFVGCDTPKFQT
jgi:NAD+ synthase (glutamine-hydrolysing)